MRTELSSIDDSAVVSLFNCHGKESDVKVLIADRDNLLLEALQAFLWDRGHEAEIAGDGLECLTILREFAPKVLVLGDDLLWGGIDGVIAQMEELAMLSQTPVILMTSKALPSHGKPPVSSQIVGELRKPVRLSELILLLESLPFDVRPARRIMPTRTQFEVTASD